MLISLQVMLLNKGNQDKGFTLIELMVVIAIIGILASVVLSSIDSARERARNVATLSNIKQYQTALELYRNQSATGTYPPAASWQCLGVGYSGGNCWSGASEASSAVNTALSPFMPVLPPGPQVGAYEGYIYMCLNNCTGYDIRVFLEGGGQSCGSGTRLSYAGTTVTYCQFLSL